MNARAAVAVLSMLVPVASFGQVSTAAVATAICRGPQGQSFDNDEGNAIATAAADFEALGFGGGYGAVMSLGGRARIQEAKLVGGIVRVEEDDDVQFGPILEMHKFNWALSSQRLAKVGDDWVLVEELPDGCIPTGAVVRRVPLIGAGPFVTLRLGADEVVQSFGFGLMLGFRKAENDKSLNLGFAYVWDPNVKTLGDGIAANAALPAGETEVRYRTTSQGGILLMFSVGW